MDVKLIERIEGALQFCAQFMDAVALDAKKEGWWTKHDQHVRDEVSWCLSVLQQQMPASPPADVAGLREAARLKIVELLWEDQFTGTAWAGKFHLIRRDSLAEYGALADKIFDGLRSIRALPIPEPKTDAAGIEVAANWHEKRAEGFKKEAADAKAAYERAGGYAAFASGNKVAERCQRQWQSADNMVVLHIDCAAALRRLSPNAAPTDAAVKALVEALKIASQWMPDRPLTAQAWKDAAKVYSALGLNEPSKSGLSSSEVEKLTEQS